MMTLPGDLNNMRSRIGYQRDKRMHRNKARKDHRNALSCPLTYVFTAELRLLMKLVVPKTITTRTLSSQVDVKGPTRMHDAIGLK